MINYRCQYLSNTPYTYRIDKRILYKHPCIQHCSVFSFFESLTSSKKILDKADFNSHIFHFISDYCYDRCLLESTWTWVKGMTTTISCTGVVSVSASCSRHCNLTQFSFSPSCFLMYYASWSCHVVTSQSYIQCRYIPVSLRFTNSYLPLSFSSLCLSCNLSSSLRSLHLVKCQRAHLAREVQQDKPMDETRQHYLSRNETCVVQTMGRQDEFKKNKQYRGVVRTTRILADLRRSINVRI